jgi:hypothetical protein
MTNLSTLQQFFLRFRVLELDEGCEIVFFWSGSFGLHTHHASEAVKVFHSGAQC